MPFFCPLSEQKFQIFLRNLKIVTKMFSNRLAWSGIKILHSAQFVAFLFSWEKAATYVMCIVYEERII